MKRALFSVSDKTGVAEFARALKDRGWEVIATGGTQQLLEREGIATTGISEVTGFPEICDGRVKTLHPAVHGALLARRDDREHMGTLCGLGILPIDLVCVNLYPFRQTVARAGVTLAEATEQIDIGGPSMLRSAAKNNVSVTVVCDPADYAEVLAEIAREGDTTPELRLRLAARAYTHTAEYDMAIAAYMRREAGLSEKLSCRSSGRRSSATARIPISGRLSTAKRTKCPTPWLRPGSCMAKNYRTTTYRMRTPHWSCCANSTIRAAWPSST